MIELSTLWFKELRATWEGHDYYHEWPKSAYLSKPDAETGIQATEVVVSWKEMESRIFKDIHNDA